MAQVKDFHTKIITDSETLTLVKSWKHSGETIVFTNGCFDLIHAGHVLYLQEAASLGDRLIVALNGDLSVTHLKGEGRPIISLVDRQSVIASLACVDIVLSFDEATPERLIELIRPDTLVKGGDWSVDKMPGASFVKSYGGQVKSLTLKENLSTTYIVNKIRSL
jgi:D-beta-D-heptose 7-phosphate kinase/D-beta-D-heptose 1-phosphate adenosyltransferase